MKNQLQVFENKELGKIRVIEIDGQPWWVLTDICRVLGLTTPSRVAERLDEDEVSQTHIIDRLGRNQETSIITESGLYAVILRSDKPNAKMFRRWITHDVLPSIRKHGAYMTDALLDEVTRSQDAAFELIARLQSERAKNSALLDKVERLAPKARYYDTILQCQNAVQASIIAKDYGMTCVAFNKLLYGLGVQYKIGDTWLLRVKYASEGYTITRTYHASDRISKIHTYWTQRGRCFLYDLLKWYGILPTAEKTDGALMGGDDNFCQ